MKYYLAYGSNMSMEQMARRCPDAFPVATCTLPDYLPCFKGSGTGAYLTIEKDLDYRLPGTPCVVWAISEEDEKRLDRYEGFPTFYYKKTVKVNARPLYMAAGSKGRLIRIEAMVYIMHEERELGSPTNHYLDICMEGYSRFGFNPDLLLDALMYSEGYPGMDEPWPEEECELPWETPKPKKKKLNWDQMVLFEGGAE